MKIEYAVKNLRSLKDTNLIELKQINILVGRNSAGKSTFARTFPLLKQSIQTRSSAPILWWGDDVDFGDFKTSVHNRDETNDISFHYKLTYDSTAKLTRQSLMNEDEFSWSTPRDIANDIAKQSCSLSFHMGSLNEKTLRRRTEIEVLHRGRLSVEFDNSGRVSKEILINGNPASELIDGLSLIFPESNIFSKPSSMRRSSEDGRTWRRPLDLRQAIVTAISATIKPMVDARTSPETITQHAQDILKIPGLSKDGLEVASQRTSKVTFKKLFLKLAADRHTEKFRRLENLCSLYYMYLSLQLATERLRGTFLATSYLKPVRVRGERFTRSQELEVSEVSPDGSNLPVFLASLNEHQREDFSNWVESLYGYGVSVIAGSGQISIALVQGDFRVNVADTGYGISQILPVLAKTWWSTTQVHRRSRPTLTQIGLPQIIVMEQPELHLHPAHQARLADVFVNSIEQSSNENPPIFVIETHSETLINRLGELIEENPELKERVQILVFTEKSESGEEPKAKYHGSLNSLDFFKRTKEASIEISTFDEEGSLKNWPYGFFGYKQ